MKELSSYSSYIKSVDRLRIKRFVRATDQHRLPNSRPRKKKQCGDFARAEFLKSHKDVDKEETEQNLNITIHFSNGTQSKDPEQAPIARSLLGRHAKHGACRIFDTRSREIRIAIAMTMFVFSCLTSPPLLLLLRSAAVYHDRDHSRYVESARPLIETRERTC